jgi:beta-glucanase (GH16 family)
MKRIITCSLLLLALLQAGAQEYKLIWEENFDNPELNMQIWTPEYNNKGGGNYEAQFYTPRNVRIEKHPSGVSCMVLSATRETYKGRPATSGRVNTAGKMAVQYGKIDVRVKVPKTANGLWPAFWMLGDDIAQVGWPRCGEIDIIEIGNEKGIEDNVQDRYFNGALHWGEKWNYGMHPNLAMHSVADYSLQEGFHLFTLIWTPDSVKMYLDQDKFPNVKPYFHMSINGPDEPNHPARYFHKPFHFVANLAVGGGFTGLPYYPRKWNVFPSWNKNFRKMTALPPKGEKADMYIDYIKIYQNGTPGEQFYISK